MNTGGNAGQWRTLLQSRFTQSNDVFIMLKPANINFLSGEVLRK
jgi:hypothetical protein